MVLRPGSDYGGGYADCFPRAGGGGHHFYESIKPELDSFRLQGDFPATAADHALNDDTSSIASKKRIDSLFRATTASMAGDPRRTSPGGAAGRRAKSLANDDDPHFRRGGTADYFDYGYEAARENRNMVQEKIDKMFAEISSSELDTDVSMDSAAAVGSNKYHVQYIGCAGLSGKISSLEGLQQPVRDMYFGYRENEHLANHYRRNDTDGGTGLGMRRDFSGLLEISAAGLTIRYRDDTGAMVHRTDPFPSIAVWAALKYVCRRRSPPPQRRTMAETGASSSGYEYAFLPLIADPDSSDKAPLFRDVEPGDRARLDAAGDHEPVFAVVTRKPGKRLECHGFACETENDALLMAANLYGALVTAMSSAAEASVVVEETGAGRPAAVPSTRRVLRQRNGWTSMQSSTAGSSVAGGDATPALPPPRPPRRNKKTTSSTTSSIADRDGGETPTGIAGDIEVCSDAKTFRMTVRQPPSLRRGVCNSSGSVPSVTRADETTIIQRADSTGGGDIFTKVAIPRSRSFLNTNGLASAKYSRRTAGCGIETAAERLRRRSDGSGGMGFTDMFNELRAQEGLNNMDDIMNAIIDAEGMSYNDLKPIYREFLMKLAMTLTKDELYQRTKTIMAEQKRKRNKRRSAFASSTAATATAGRGRRLNEKLLDAFNLRAAKSRISSMLLPDFCKRKKRVPKSRKQRRRCSCSVKGGSSSEHRTVVGDRKPERKNNHRRAALGKRANPPMLKSRRHGASSPVLSTSDDSDFFAAAASRQRQHIQLQQQQLLLQNEQLYRKSKTRGGKSKRKSGGSRGTITASEGGCAHRASSGYFSCSECSAGAADDKCYCGNDGAEPASLVSCSCDSDSCADSDKCYCGRPRRARNIFDELKSRGFAASESSVSRADSPGTAWKKNEQLLQQHRHDGGCQGGSSSAATGLGGGMEPSKSLEYLQVTRRRPVDQQYSSVAKPVTGDRTAKTVYGADSTTVPGSSSSPTSSLSAATVYSSSSAVGGGAAHHRRQRRSGSSGSDNFRAIDYALFANNGGAAGRASRGFGRQNHYRAGGPATNGGGRPTTATSMTRKSYSSEAVHLTGCRVYHQKQQPQAKPIAVRRHSVHDGGDDVSSSFFKSVIENSLGYYP